MIVQFNTTTFRNRHPFFTETKISDEALEFQFQVACTIVPNTETSFIPYDPPTILDREIVLDALVCHLATMALRNPDQPGAVMSAGEGSVNVSYGAMKGNEDYFSQTSCGQTFWRLMMKYKRWGGLMATPPNFHPYG